jgi:hypothetical protein
LGEYSIVWFDTLSTDGNEYVSAYVSKDGVVFVASCDAGSITVRPSGNATYPPLISDPLPDGFTIEIDLGYDGTMNLEVTAGIISVAAPGGVYTEWVGTMAGSVNGGPQLTGVASLEMFKLTD